METSEIKPVISTLFQEMVSGVSINDVMAIVSERKRDPEAGINLLIENDKKLPGKGLHNIVKPTEIGGLTGNFEIKDRPIYKPIQYLLAHYSQYYSDWDPRYIVEVSCQHLEACLGRYCHDDGKLVFGKLLNSETGKTLPEDLWAKLDLVRSEIYIKSKQKSLSAEQPYFSEVEAIAAYFICRAMGLKLL